LRGCIPWLILAAALCGASGQQTQTASFETLLAEAKQAEQAGNYAAAADAYAQAVTLRPDMPKVWANLGLMQHEMGNFAEAIRCFRKANALDPSLYVPNLFLGIDLFKTDNASDALPWLLRARALNGQDAEACQFLGRVYAALGKSSLAAGEMEHAVQLDPKRSAAWFYLGIFLLDQVEDQARTMSAAKDAAWGKDLYAESLIRQTRYNEAVGVYQQVLAGSTPPACTRAGLVLAYTVMHDAARAREQLQTAKRESPACPLIGLEEARLDVESGANQEALALLNRLWARDEGFVETNATVLTQGLASDSGARFSQFLENESTPGNVPPALTAFLLSVLKGGVRPETLAADAGNAGPASMPGDAAQSYASGHYRACSTNAVGSLRTKNAAQLRLLAICSYLTGDSALAAEAGNALVSQTPQSMEALYWSVKADEQFAFQALQHYEELEPNSERTHLLLGDIYRQRQRYEDARAQYQQALAIRPRDPAALLGLAYVEFGIANYGQAIEISKAGLEEAPTDPELNLVAGEALVERHEFASAESYLTRSLNAKPRMLSHVHALLGRVYLETGRPKDAIEQLRLGLDSDRDGTVHFHLARAYRLIGDEKDAQIAFEQMKAVQQRRRETAAIAVSDEHAPDPDDTP
jgi:tetratricopeptide (TPR) repeat protein